MTVKSFMKSFLWRHPRYSPKDPPASTTPRMSAAAWIFEQQQVTHTGQQWAWDISETTDNCCLKHGKLSGLVLSFHDWVTTGSTRSCKDDPMIPEVCGIFGSQKSWGIWWVFCTTHWHHTGLPMISPWFPKVIHRILGRVQALGLRSLGQGDGELPLLHLRAPEEWWSEK